jgi:hypothetical protein
MLENTGLINEIRTHSNLMSATFIMTLATLLVLLPKKSPKKSEPETENPISEKPAKKILIEQYKNISGASELIGSSDEDDEDETTLGVLRAKLILLAYQYAAISRKE